MDYYFNKFYSVPTYRTALIAIFFLSYAQMIMPSWRLFFIGLAVHVLFSYKKIIESIVKSVDRYIPYIFHMPVLIFIRSLTLSHPEYFMMTSLGIWVNFISICGGILYFCYFFFVVYFCAVQQTDTYRNTISACNIADVNWVNGVARIFSGYFVANSPQPRKIFY